MAVSYDLIEQPWLPCIGQDGELVELGLKDTLGEARELRELQGETPVATMALHRLLLAILHRVFGPADLSAWAELWQAGRWDEIALGDYFSRWRKRFDLFDPDHPFYQDAATQAEIKVINRMDLALAYNSTLFEHTPGDGSFSVPPSRAACWLVTLQAAGIGTGPPMNPYPSGSLVSSMLVLVEGHNLFETLILNLLQYNRHEPFPVIDDDRPQWEYDENPFPPDPKTFYLTGYLGYLTWQCRSVKLLPEFGDRGELTVRKAHLGQGSRLDSKLLRDPMKVWVKHKKYGFLPKRFNREKAAWRDAHVLLELNNPKSTVPPLAFSQIQKHIRLGTLDSSRKHSFRVLGLSSNKADLGFFRSERLPLPPDYLIREELVERLREGLAIAERVADAIYKAEKDLIGWVLSPKDKSKAKKDGVKMLRRQIRMQFHYWAGLELDFGDFFTGLPEEVDGAMECWTKAVCMAARSAFDAGVQKVNDPRRVLKAATLARETLERGIGRALAGD